MLDQSILSDIRDRTPIVAFIGERVPLKKAGRNYRGSCPFHQEKTPSFMVSDEKQIFHCFGCGEGGDVFKFLMKYENLTFMEAVKTLAERSQVVLPKGPLTKEPDENLARKKKWCLRLNQLALEYFHASLIGPQGDGARNYLKSRQIKDSTLKQLFLGYAEKNQDNLVRFLEAKKAPLLLAVEMGLIKSGRDGTYYDFFRGRLMFPIISPRGEVIGFSGRILDDDKEAAKYLNSPDSFIYHKSNSVYGLNLAVESIRKAGFIVLVEGNMDMVSLYQAGIQNVVAPLGTALTSGHIRLISRYTKGTVVLFDGDKAGQTAAARALPLFLEAGLVPRAVSLSQEEDPDSFVKKHGAQKLLDIINSAPTLFEFVVDHIAGDAKDMAARISALQQIIPLLKGVKDTVALNLYRGYTASRLRIREDVVDEAMRGGRKNGRGEGQDKDKKTNRRSDSIGNAERLIVEIMVGKPHLAAKLAGRISADQFSDLSLRTIAEIFFKEYKTGEDLNLSAILENIADAELAHELREIAMSDKVVEDREAQEILDDCIEIIEKKPLAMEILRLNEAIRDAEEEGNEVLLLELLAKKRDLSQSVVK